MRNGKRGRYTRELKQEAVRLVESSQSIAETSRQSETHWNDAYRPAAFAEISRHG